MDNINTRQQDAFAQQITPRIERYVKSVWRGNPEIEDLLQVARIASHTTIKRKTKEPQFNPETLYAAVKARVHGALLNHFRDSAPLTHTVPIIDNLVRAEDLPTYTHQEKRSSPITVHLTQRQREGLKQVSARYGSPLADVIRAGVELMLAAAAEANPPAVVVEMAE